MSKHEAGPVLILGLNYAPEAIGIGPYTTGLAERFAALGHPMTVVAGRPYYPQWQAHKGSTRWWSRTHENGIELIRCPHYIPRRPGGLKRLLHHASFALASLVPMLQAARSRPAAVIAIAPSLVAAPVAWLAARLSGAKLWLHVQDFEVESALATGLLRERSLAARAGRGFERWILRRTDLVTTISAQMCRRLGEKGVAAHRIGELRNWANHCEAIAGADGEELRRQWGLQGKFVALYAGNIANKQGLESVIEAARMLAGDTRIAFVICGEGPNRARLEALAEGLANVAFHGLQPEHSFGRLMRMADCHLLPQLRDASDLVLPSKLANMLASERPVIATTAPGTGIAQEVDGCGLIVAAEDSAALAAAIRSLADDPMLCHALGETAGQRARDRWRKEAVLAQADQLLGRLLHGGCKP